MTAARKPRKPGPARSVDWEAVERDYRCGRFTLRELGAKYGVGHSAIGNRATRYGWTRDLSRAVRQATNAKLIEATISERVDESRRAVSDAVMAAAQAATNVVLGHRKDIASARELAGRMLAELDASTTRQDELRALLSAVADDLDEEARAALVTGLRGLTGLHARVKSLERMAASMARLQQLERQAFGIRDEDDKGADALANYSDDELEREAEALRARLAQAGANVVPIRRQA